MPKPMNALPTCEEIVRQLWPHLDGALPESERARVIAHLEGCENCRTHFDFARAFLDAVHNTPTPPQEFAALRLRVEEALAGVRGEGDE